MITLTLSTKPFQGDTLKVSHTYRGNSFECIVAIDIINEADELDTHAVVMQERINELNEARQNIQDERDALIDEVAALRKELANERKKQQTN